MLRECSTTLLTECSTTLQQVVDNIDQVVHFCACSGGNGNLMAVVALMIHEYFMMLHVIVMVGGQKIYQ